MVMVVQNAMGAVEEIQTGKSPDRPEIIADNERRGLVEKKPEPKEAKEAKEPDPKETQDDDEPEFAKRLGLTDEQHKGVTEAFKAAIAKKHRQAKDAEDFAANLYRESRLAEERAQRAEQERDEAKKAAQPAVKEAEEPKRDAFPDDKSYQDALIDWRVDQRLKAREAEEAKTRQKERESQIMEAARERVARAIELVPDFEEVTSEANDIIPSHIAAYMQESELFPELGYHFAKHPEDLKALSAMPARTYSDLLKVGVALDKIESKIQPFSKEKETPSKASTNGHAPSQDTGTVPSQPRSSAPVIQPLSVASASQVDKPEASMTYAEARAKFEKAKGVNLSRRSRH